LVSKQIVKIIIRVCAPFCEFYSLRLWAKTKVLTQQGLKHGLNRSAKPFVLDKSLSKS